MTPQTSSKGGHHSLHQESVFATVKEPKPMNFMQRYNEDLVTKLASLLWTDLGSTISKQAFDRLQNTEHLPMTDDLPKLLHAQVQKVLPQFMDLILNSEFVQQLHTKESHAVKSRTLGAVLREEKIPFVQGGVYKAVIVDNLPKDLSPNSKFVTDSEVDTQMACVNPYCHIMGQFKFKGKDGKTDFYCPKCKTTWHWIAMINNQEAE